MSEPSAKRRKTLNAGDSHISDPRFSNIQSDPRYKLPGKKERVRLDSRFARVLQDEDFAKRAKVDRYGRPLEDDAARKRLKQKFELETDEEEDDEPDDDDEVQAELQRVEKAHDPLREGKDVSSSDDDSSSDEESEVAEDEDVVGPGQQSQDVPLGEVTSRIAVVNLDWDNIRAEDLMAVFSSFLPSSGRLLKVVIYPSEFGKERIEREELEGPPKEIFAAGKGKDQEDDSESEQDDEAIKAYMIKPDDGSEFDSAALRQYQLERLRYYYAVLVFSSPVTAKAIYDSVDGTEYLSTANFFDLRFIPDETDFTTDTPREECEQLPSGYKPNEFVTDALQHSKVKLTWDAEDSGRKEAVARAFRGGQREIDENDLKAYIGSDSSGSEQEEDIEMVDASQPKAGSVSSSSKKETERQKMRALLGLGSEPEKKSKKNKNGQMGDIKITFSSGLSSRPDELDDQRPAIENSPEREETTVEKYVRKEKERKQKRKEQRKAPSANENQEDEHTSVDEAERETDGDLGFDDPFFNEPLEGNQKSSSKLRKEERAKRRKEREAEEVASAKQRAELELLMGSDEDENGANGASRKHAGRTVKHFDMNDVEKAEKQARKDKKKKRHDKGGRNRSDIQADDFKMHTDDPRFAQLFDSHEYAIDPTNPRFKGTKGMQQLLDEGRKRRSRDDKRARHDVETKAKKRDRGSEVQSLVEKIKKRN